MTPTQPTPLHPLTTAPLSEGIPTPASPLPAHTPVNASATSTPSSPSAETAIPTGTKPRIRIVPHIESARSLHFEVVDREVEQGTIIKIGRFTERLAASNRITFKSKVVSRAHAELWTVNGQFFIKDTKSSSGTFLNHIRLSPPNQESRAFALKDGDVVQLGVDYQGGTEDIYRCVKMRLEINRMWQKANNPFRLNALRTLRALRKQGGTKDNHDCCICLCVIAPFQALFVAPCSHSFHYKCARPLLLNWPAFTCPLCRTFADLEASVSTDNLAELFGDELDLEDAGEGGSKPEEVIAAQGVVDPASVDGNPNDTIEGGPGSSSDDADMGVAGNDEALNTGEPVDGGGDEVMTDGEVRPEEDTSFQTTRTPIAGTSLDVIDAPSSSDSVPSWNKRAVPHNAVNVPEPGVRQNTEV